LLHCLFGVAVDRVELSRDPDVQVKLEAPESKQTNTVFKAKHRRLYPPNHCIQERAYWRWRVPEEIAEQISMPSSSAALMVASIRLRITLWLLAVMATLPPAKFFFQKFRKFSSSRAALVRRRCRYSVTGSVASTFENRDRR
jgi:hypothetical protein